MQAQMEVGRMLVAVRAIKKYSFFCVLPLTHIDNKIKLLNMIKILNLNKGAQVKKPIQINLKEIKMKVTTTTIKEVKDDHNDQKIHCFKFYKDGHVTYNQKIAGSLYCPKWQRVDHNTIFGYVNYLKRAENVDLPCRSDLPCRLCSYAILDREGEFVQCQKDDRITVETAKKKRTKNI